MSTSPECTSAGRLLGAHLDGQLDAMKTIEVEEHLSRCEVCRERVALDRALRGSLKKAVRTATPDDVRARMLAAMAGERARETQRETGDEPLPLQAEPAPSRGRLRHWRTMLPLASAAALALAWGFAGKQPLAHGGAPDAIRAGFGNDDMLRDFVDLHSRPPPPEQTDPTQVRALERYVGVPVHIPRFKQNARFVGGRLLPVHGGESAAMLQYEITQGTNVQRVSVFVYDPARVQVRGPNLAPRAVGTSEVRVGQARGYSVAVAQHGGVGYAIASDLDADSSARLVAGVDSD